MNAMPTYLYWDNISRYQKLSPQFMDRWCDKLNWQHVSTYQALPEEFIIQHLHLLDLTEIRERYPSTYQNYNLELVQVLTKP